MRRALAVVGATAVLVLLASLWALAQLRSSLPLLEGTVTASGLSTPVTVARDAHGVPTLTGRTRADLAWVLGYLHAQERFFQMDGQRRLAAGGLPDWPEPLSYRRTGSIVCIASAPVPQRYWPQ